MYCKHCAAEIDNDAIICTKCGKQVAEIKGSEPQNIIINNSASSSASASATTITQNLNQGKAKNKTTAIILCCLGFLGFAGIHKFYEGKIVLGIIYLLTGGLFAIGTIIDLFSLLSKPSTYYI